MATTAPGPGTPPRTLHYINNLHGQTADTVALGYNLFDVDPSLSTLPATGQALVWVGEKCPTPPTADWKAVIDRLVHNPRVFGYYLSDEPSDAACAAGMRERADYIAKASGGKQISFVVLLHPDDYVAFRPEVTHVSLIGLDPYPKSINGFRIDQIAEKVHAAEAAGIPAAKIVPTYEAFGQERTASPYYAMPTPAQTQAILDEWHALVPHPVFDYTYTWGHQSDANPTLIDFPAVQSVYKAWNASHPPSTTVATLTHAASSTSIDFATTVLVRDGDPALRRLHRRSRGRQSGWRRSRCKRPR